MKNISDLKHFTYPLTILYIESNETLQNKMERYLNALFSKVYQARDSIRGLKIAQKNKPNIIVTDLTFGQESAFEMLLEIQKLDKSIQIIVISKRGEDFQLLESFDIGLVALLEKPLDFNQLYHALKIASKKFSILPEETLSLELPVSLFQKEQKVECTNNYHGLYLHNSAVVLSYDRSGRLEIKLNKIQLIAAIHEKQIIIEVENQRILFKLVRVDRNKNSVILSTPITLQNNERDPENKRILVDKSFKASVGFKSKLLEVKPINISYEYLAVTTTTSISIEINDKIELTLGFEINGPSSFIAEKKFTKVFASGEIQRIEKFDDFVRLTIKLSVKKSGESVFKKYLKQRELDIISDLKKRIQK